MLLETRSITQAVIQQTRASEQYTSAIINARVASFTLELLPRRADDMGTLVLPKKYRLPKPLIDQLIELAGFLRCRATEGTCSPVKLLVQPTPHWAPN